MLNLQMITLTNLGGIDMKKYLKSKGVLAVLLSGILLSGVGLVGCGGGGGGAGGGGEGSGGGSGSNGGSNVMSAESALTAAYHSVFLSYLDISGVSAGGGPCEGGGNISVSPEGNTLTITYNNCRYAGQYYEEGMVVGYEWLWNGTIKALMAEIGGCPMPTRVETLNLKMVIREDRGEDGIWDTDLEYNISNFVKTHSYTLGSQCEINSVKVDYSTQGNGSISITDRVKGDNFTLRNLSMTATLTLTSSSDKESLSGTMTVTSSCYTASLNIQTLEDFITPTGGDCPTSGKIRITGGTNATYIFTSTGGIQIDLGNDGTIDKTYNKCSDTFSPICKR